MGLCHCGTIPCRNKASAARKSGPSAADAGEVITLKEEVRGEIINLEDLNASSDRQLLMGLSIMSALGVIIRRAAAPGGTCA